MKTRRAFQVFCGVVPLVAAMVMALSVGGCSDSCDGVVCDSPPSNVCEDSQTLRVYEREGRCVDGECVYDSTLVDCPEGCEDGWCEDRPYNDDDLIPCPDSTPVARCVAPGKIRMYQLPQPQDPYGRCSVPVDFPSITVDCTDCCQGAGVNPTENPIAGGELYTNYVRRQDYVVSDASGLLQALETAVHGDTVYIPNDAVIDLTGHERIRIPDGVTLASGRGYGGDGGLVFTTQYDTRPLFYVEDGSVRITGLRIQGPDTSVGDHLYDTPPLSRGIEARRAVLEVDNCEIYGFSHAAIALDEGSEGHIHHNHIHHNGRAGLGYGVVLDRATAVIEANLFDHNRHSIAGTGRPGTSYEARYNVVLPHAAGHHFDMHGEPDYMKRVQVAVWRFDEGEGPVAHDGAIYHSNDCTLENMDDSSWVQGVHFWALFFDGVDDSLTCANDGSLASPTGTVEFWIRPMGGQGTVFEAYVDEDNYFAIFINDNNKLGVSTREGGREVTSVIGSVSLDGSAFTHVAVVQDGTRLQLYLDGQSTTLDGTDSSAWTAHLQGASITLGTGTFGRFTGILDDVRVYREALDVSDIALHAQGIVDMAGTRIDIHHNTFLGTTHSAVVIRGIPIDGASIHHNWFFDPSLDHAVRQAYTSGGLEISYNHNGFEPPEHILSPVVLKPLGKFAGTAPLKVELEAAVEPYDDYAPQLAAFLWDYGRGMAPGPFFRVSPTFQESGHTTAMFLVLDEKGSFAFDTADVVARPPEGRYVLDFWVKDSYRGTEEGYYVLQAVVNGTAVWEEDAAGDVGWHHISVPVDDIVGTATSVEVEFRVTSPGGAPSSDVPDFYAYFDDVYLFGAEDNDGDFEGAHIWEPFETGPSTAWYTGVTTEEARSGWYSYRLAHGYGTSCPSGATVGVRRTFSLISPHLRAWWTFDEPKGFGPYDGSLYGHDAVSPTDWSYRVPGAIGRAVRFDGFHSGIVRVSDALLPEVGTLDFFVKGEGEGEGWIFHVECDDGSEFGIQYSGGFIHVVGLGGAEPFDFAAPLPLDDGVFHHVAVVNDGSEVRLYVDGTQRTDRAAPLRWWRCDAPSEVSIGRSSRNLVIDEVRIQDTVHGEGWAAEEFAKMRPVAEWHLDEGTGVVVVDSAGSHDGTLVDMDPSWAWTEGISGGALRFGGSGRVEIEGSAAFASPQGSIEFWVNAGDVGEDQDVLNLFEDGYENYLLIRMLSDGRLYVRIEDDDQALVSVATTEPIPFGRFHHVVVTQRGAGVRIYVDGRPVRVWGKNSGAWTSHLSVQALWLGQGHWHSLHGVLDEVRIWRRPLRECELK